MLPAQSPAHAPSDTLSTTDRPDTADTADTPATAAAAAAAAAVAVAAPVGRSGPLAVLDSNVWIDILVFDDPVTRPILAALENATLRSVTDARCLHELQRVLDYPQFARFAIDKASAMATVLRLSTVQPAADATQADVKTAADAAAQAAIAARDHASAATAGPSRATAGLAPAHAPAATAPRTGPSLPLCSDRDDQKFLELAAASQADWLVTKDKALLKLSRRMTRDFSCRVDRPAGFVAAALALP